MAPLAHLPDDPVELELTLRTRLQQILFDAVGTLSGNILLWPRYPGADEEDLALSTVPDPVTGEPMTNVITIGLATVQEGPYTDDAHTGLTFTYDITFDLGVVDLWADPALEFKSSVELATAVYMRARYALKYNRTLGFLNVEHDYLQQVNISEILDDKGEAELLAADWSIIIRVSNTRA